MDKKKKVLIGAFVTGIVAGIIFFFVRKKIHQKKITQKEHRETMYEQHTKRVFDVTCALLAITCFGWLYLIVAFLVKVKLGSPVLFTQPRPGKDEKIFKMYKFRTMTDERDENGELLPDEVRLTSFGKWLRSTSLDELPEAFNILKGDMSVIGPRPQLVRDMVFMTDEQRKRHSVRPGLSGLAQVNGRNDIDWEDKLNWDLKYIKKISFFKDVRIIFQTVMKAFVKKEGITEGDMATAEDFGDYLLRTGKITQEEYEEKQKQADMILNGGEGTFQKKNLTNFNYSVSMCVYGGDKAEWFKTAVNSILHQTLPPSEIVLVVDGAVPNDLSEIIELFEQNILFKVIRLKENQGHGIARRTGLQACSNELVAIMDADDISNPNRFQKQIEVFKEKPDIDIVGGMITEFVDTPENIVGKRIVPLTDRDIKAYMKRRCPMNLVTVMFKKSSIESVGGFIDWYCEEDYYLWIRMSLHNMKFANVTDELVKVRVGKKMYQRRGGIKYFKSEEKLQRYMLKNKIIGLQRYVINVSERLILQVFLPNKIRGYIFKKLARSK